MAAASAPATRSTSAGTARSTPSSRPHDRYFLNRVCDAVYSIDDGVLRHLEHGLQAGGGDFAEARPVGEQLAEILTELDAAETRWLELIAVEEGA
jgi:hypothetical protein